MERLIKIEGTFNCRDLGGYKTADGRTIAYRRLIRSDALCSLTDAGLSQLIELGIKTVVDFRSPSEALESPNRLPGGIKTIVLPPNAEIAAQASASKSRGDAARVQKLVELSQTEEGKAWFLGNEDSMEKQMRIFVTNNAGIKAFGAFLKLLAADCDPLLFHCKGGKDRTGWAAALILSILDVPRATIIEDYMATALYNKDRNENRMNQYRELTDNPIVLSFMSSLMQVKESYILAAFEETEKLGGIKKYLTDIMGLSAAEQASLKEKYTQ